MSAMQEDLRERLENAVAAWVSEWAEGCLYDAVGVIAVYQAALISDVEPIEGGE